MDFALTNEQKTFAKEFEKFCQQKIAPFAKEADKMERLPENLWKELADYGYFAAHFPENQGGFEVDILTQGLAHEILASYCASSYLSAGASIGLGGIPISNLGNEEQLENYLKPMIKGEKISCLGLTEPGTGSDLSAIKTKVDKSSSGYVLNGEKALITNAPIADHAVIFTVSDSSKGYGGFSLFLVDLNLPGITRSKPYKKLGVKASPTGTLTFENVELPASALLGQEGQGFYYVMQTLELGRLGMSYYSIGIAEAAYRASLKYATERQTFGKPIARKQAINFKIADMKIEIETSRLMARRVAWMKDQGKTCPDLASVSKLYASEMAVRVTDWARQVHGGWGYTDDFEVERLFRDARLGPIGEGTSEIQREIISKSLLGF